MKTLPTALASHYAGGTTTLADLLKITRKDGQVFAFTSASTDVTIAAQLHTSAQGLDISSLEVTAGLAVDNLELTTLDDGTIFSRVEVLAGVWRNADFVISRYNWANPADGIEVRMVGTVGEVHLKRGSITAELRGLQQYLQQPIGSVTSKTCRARLGDSMCTRDLADMTHLVEVSAVTSRQVFSVVDVGAGPSDPNFASVSLLLHGDGPASIFDNSPLGHVVTAGAGTTIDTAQSKFGGASIAFSGALTSNATVPSSASLEPGGGDFTIEFWMRASAVPSVAGFIVSRANASGYSNFSVGYRSTQKIEAYFSLDNSATLPSVITSATSVVINTWTHIAFVKTGLTHKLYINGVLDATLTAASNPPAGLSTQTKLGSDGTYSFNGHIDDLRITKGVARYASNFTPHTSPFPDSEPSGGALPATADWFAEGLATWTSGANDGLTVKVKTSSDANAITLTLPMLSPITLGDTMTLVAGCRKRLSDCSGKFNNVINFQGEPHLPGVDQITAPA